MSNIDLEKIFNNFIPYCRSEKSNDNTETDCEVGQFCIEPELFGDDTGGKNSGHGSFKNGNSGNISFYAD